MSHEEMSLRPRPGETAEETVDRVVAEARKLEEEGVVELRDARKKMRLPTPESLRADRDKRAAERTEIADAYELGAAVLEQRAGEMTIESRREQRERGYLMTAARHLRDEARPWREPVR